MTYYDKWLNKYNVLDRVDQRTIFKKYFPVKIDLRRNKYLNPFRPDKKEGSCHFNWWRGKLKFFDKATGESYDCFDFLMKRYNLSFYECLYKLNIDFDLKLRTSDDCVRVGYIYSINSSRKQENYFIPKYINSRNVSFKVKTRKWDENDKNYWLLRFGITSKTLKKHNVYPVKSYDANYLADYWKHEYEYVKDSGNICYVYLTTDRVSGKEHVKLYHPLETNRDLKWRSDGQIGLVHGLNCLANIDLTNPKVLSNSHKLVTPSSGISIPSNLNFSDVNSLKEGINNVDRYDILYICSSLKDGMCIEELGYYFASGSTEISRLTPKVWVYLKKRFKYICYLLDNDDAGLEWSIKMSKENDVYYSILPKIGKCKDIAEIVENYGQNTMRNIMSNLQFFY